MQQSRSLINRYAHKIINSLNVSCRVEIGWKEIPNNPEKYRKKT